MMKNMNVIKKRLQRLTLAGRFDLDDTEENKVASMIEDMKDAIDNSSDALDKEYLQLQRTFFPLAPLGRSFRDASCTPNIQSLDPTLPRMIDNYTALVDYLKDNKDRLSNKFKTTKELMSNCKTMEDMKKVRKSFQNEYKSYFNYIYTLANKVDTFIDKLYSKKQAIDKGIQKAMEHPNYLGQDKLEGVKRIQAQFNKLWDCCDKAIAVLDEMSSRMQQVKTGLKQMQ